MGKTRRESYSETQLLLRTSSQTQEKYVLSDREKDLWERKPRDLRTQRHERPIDLLTERHQRPVTHEPWLTESPRDVHTYV